MTPPDTRSPRTPPQLLTVPAGWMAVLGLVVAASLWASEPGTADPSSSSWIPGRTVTTWDWEQHWNYWMEWECVSVAILPGFGKKGCYSWSKVGPTWKPCGPEIRPPQVDRTNTCNIGRPGGHRPHGDNITKRYTYLGQHEDRTGPTYAICADDRTQPPDTSPGMCGTWVTSHSHCPGNQNAHPPDCPPGDGSPTEGTDPPGQGSSLPPQPSGACAMPGVAGAFKEAVDRQPDPGHGLQPPAYGYVRVPLRTLYRHEPLVRFSTGIGTGNVDIRMWVAEISWSFTDLGTADGDDLGARTFRRTAADHRRAAALRTPAAVVLDGQPVAYHRSSLRSGNLRGYPVSVTVVWRAECFERGGPDPVYLGEQVRDFTYRYKVYEIRSLPEL